MALGIHNPNGYFYSSFNPTQLNKRSFSDTILRLFPNGSAPLYALTGDVNKKVAKAVEHGYFTKHMAYARLTVNDPTGMVAGDTTMTVDSTAGIVKGMVFQVPSTRENIRVASVDSATQVTIQRGFGRIVAGTISDNEVLTPVGNTATEASDRPTARTLQSTYVPNYTGICRNAWALSDTAKAALSEAGFDNIAESRLDCMEFHSTDIETKLWWGQAVAPTTDPLDNKPIHDTQGLIDAIYQHASGNEQTAGATTNYAQMRALIEPAFAYTSSKNASGAKERTVFCDSQAMNVFQDIGRLSGQINQTVETTTFGMHFTKMRTHKGVLNLVEHPLFTELAPAAGFAVVTDLTSVALAYLKGRDVKKEEYDGSADGSNNGVDASGGSLTTEFATEFMTPNTCAVINGLTAGTA